MSAYKPYRSYNQVFREDYANWLPPLGGGTALKAMEYAFTHCNQVDCPNPLEMPPYLCRARCESYLPKQYSQTLG